MINKHDAQGRVIAIRTNVIQLTIVLFLSLLFSVFWGKLAGISALAGGLCVVLPGTLFAFAVFGFSGARSAYETLASFYAGEIVKVLLTLMGLVVTHLLLRVEAVPLFTTFSLALVIQSLVPMMLLNNKLK